MALFHREATPRDQILEQLWPEQSINLAIQALNSVTSGVNKYCRRHFDCPNLILYEQGYYRFNTEAGVGLDIEIFENYALQGRRLLAQGNTDEGLAQCKEALSYYRGDLNGDGSLQALIMREHLRTVLLDLLTTLANYYYTHDDPGQALDYLNRLLARDPCREDAHRQIMRCYVGLGLRAQALRQYQLCLQALDIEFNTAPEAATISLFDQIRTNPASVTL